MKNVPCAVCGKTLPASNPSQCPQCGADLACFGLLASLADQDEMDASIKHLNQAIKLSARRYFLALIVVIVSISALFFWYQHRSFQAWREERTATITPSIPAPSVTTHRSEVGEAREKTVQEAVTDINRLSRQISRLEARMTDLSVKASSKKTERDQTLLNRQIQQHEIFLYEPLKNETLWRISKKHYRRGALYPVLLETNPGLRVFFKPDDEKINILKNARVAKEIFARVVFVKKGKRFYRHPVRTGDTWEGLSERFYGRLDRVQTLKALNEDVSLIAGTRVIVPLDE